MEILKSFLGGSVAAVLLTGIFSLIQWKLSRKAQKEDFAAQNKVTDCAARGTEIRSLQDTSQCLVIALRTILYNDIKSKAKEYIQRGYISVEEYEDLKQEHEVYHSELSGNSFLDALMKDVDHLQKR